MPRMLPARLLVLVALASAALASAFAPAEWPQLGGDSARSSQAEKGPTNVSATLWDQSQDGSGNALIPDGAGGAIVCNGRVFVNARQDSGSTHTQNKLVAFDLASGSVLFERMVAKSVLNSRSTPAAASGDGVVLVATGSVLHAIDAIGGALAWSAPLDHPVVNASPAVSEGGSPGRAFITDYDPFGADGWLYCFNTSPFHPDDNPHQPGDMVWAEPIGATSGATPAFQNGRVFVATIEDPLGDPGVGVIRAYDVDAPPSGRLAWRTSVAEGFFGGVSVCNGFVYAASYDFYGTGDNSTLVKLRASDGAIMWTVACERTASIPVVRGDRIYLSAGIQGFGSVPKVQAFDDLGTYAVKAWDTWTDTGGALVVGGWTVQPTLAGHLLYVGRAPTSGNFYGPAVELFVLDVTRAPGQPGFVVQQRAGFGSAPALAGGRLLTLGASGLFALATRGDYSLDGFVNGADIQGFVSARLSASPTAGQVSLGDFSGNGSLEKSDAEAFRDILLCR